MTMAVLLVVFWLLAWGEVSAVNVLSGVALAVVLLGAFPRRRPGTSPERLRIGGAFLLILYVLRQLVVSSALVAREIVSRRGRVRTGVVAYQLRDAAPEILSTVANAIALTPGTMTVEATTDPPVVYVHFLVLEDVEEARREIARLERFVRRAFGRPTIDAEAP